MQFQDDIAAITHSPYYGCTVRAVSKAGVAYEGILDGIGTSKDRIFLRNVRVRGHVKDTDRAVEGLNSLNAVMIDHLTNDMHIYEQVCLNVRDIRQLKLLRLPSTSVEFQARPRQSMESIDDRSRILSSSEESVDQQIETLNQLAIGPNSKPVTLLAKKVLPKRIERIPVSSRGPSDRKASPIRVTITSKLNPDAAPFYTRQASLPSHQHSSLTFYEQNQFRKRNSQQRFVPPRSKPPTEEKASPPRATNQLVPTPPMRERLSVPGSNHPRRSPTNSLRSTGSLPFQYGMDTFDRRRPRTVSGTSSGSSFSMDIGPHSIVQFDSSSNSLTSADGQYDFEKANEEFRRYLELEELVTRRTSSVGSFTDDVSPQPSNSYKREVSFFDRISCTATTGTAVGYTEMDENEKNWQTFGDDALGSDANDSVWCI